MFKRGLLCGLLLVLSALGSALAKVKVEDGAGSPMLEFALESLRSTAPEVNLVVARDAGLPVQGYRIERVDGRFWAVTGADDHGLMYGVLDLEESLRLGLDPEKEKAPKVRRRGLKFNIPLDARCPSYDDSGTAAVRNIPEMWSRDFWHGYLDSMANNRYNVLTLWSNHPFTTMVKVPDYPEVAIPDVAVPTYEMDEHMLIQYRKEKLQDPQFYKVVRKMTMDEKIEHWRHVMRYAKERGIDLYFITWNIWLHGAEGKYGIDDDQTNPKTVKYLRESMKEMVLTYPDLKGFGITAGENMKNDLKGEDSAGNWLWNTYGEGISDALKEQPGREFDFIHRVWYTGIGPMMDSFIDKYPGRCDVGFKYARARLYSTAKPPFFDKQLRAQVEKFEVGCWMNLRNDDIYHFRWGDPDYVREYVGNLPDEPVLAGIHMGSDGYVWGREFTSREPEEPRQLEVDKHWYRFAMWGRLSYDPSLDHRYFEARLKDRFPEADAELLYRTWQIASRIVPKINLTHWRDWDHMWSVETCMSKKEGYHTVDHFIEFGPMAGSGGISIPDFVKNPEREGVSPVEAAEQLDNLAARTLRGISGLKSGAEGFSKELSQTVGDLEAFAHLASYYADKLRGSTEVHRFRAEGKAASKASAVDHLENALDHWREYAGVASSQYEVQLLARVNTTDWLGVLLDHAKHDIQMAKDAEQGVFPESVLLSNMPEK